MPDPRSERCGCAATDPGFPQTRAERELGEDKTKGRYAEVGLLRCTRCGTLWIKYFVEYETFAASGRWCMAPIDEATGAAIRPEEVPAYLEAAPWFIFGGSYFNHGAKRGRGKLRWDL